MHRLLNLQHVSKSYGGIRALNNIYFGLNSGEVHCLCGENGSGKSSLIKIISGLEKPTDSLGSSYYFDNKFYSFGKATQKQRLGIGVLFQDLALFPQLTVWDNIVIGELAGLKRIMVPKRSLKKRAMKILEQFELDLPLETPLESLGFGKQQLVSLARILFNKPKVLLLDEPTSGLSYKESRHVHTIINKLKAEGCAILLISHKIDEVLNMADRISIIRDGNIIGEYKKGELDEKELIYKMSGKELLSEKTDQSRDFPTLLETEGINGYKGKNINFTLGEGEIVGIAGKLGSGRSEFAKMLFGINRIESGTVFIDDIEVKIKNPDDAIKHGIGYVPENRILEGIITHHSIGNNIILASIDQLANRFGILNKNKTDFTVSEWISTLNIQTLSEEAPIEALSGGNQQKCVLARWIATDPRILILDKPTTGIDIATKNNIHQLIHILTGRGMGVIWISDNAKELLGNTDRIYIMDDGEIVNEMATCDISLNDLNDAICE